MDLSKWPWLGLQARNMTGPGSVDAPGDELVSRHGPLLAPGVGPEHADARLRGAPLRHGQHHRKLVGPRQPVDGAVEGPGAGGGPARCRCRPTHPMSGRDCSSQRHHKQGVSREQLLSCLAGSRAISCVPQPAEACLKQGQNFEWGKDPVWSCTRASGGLLGARTEL